MQRLETIINERTEQDKIVQTLANTKSRCLNAIARGICTKEKCNECPIGQKLGICYDQLPVYTQLAVDVEAARIDEGYYNETATVIYPQFTRRESLAPRVRGAGVSIVTMILIAIAAMSFIR